MSSRSGEQAVQGMGPVCGRSLHSYRAEATGILSVLRFLIRLREWIVATDSESLLNTLSAGAVKKLRQDIPLDLDINKVILDIMIPEWDVLIEIQKSLKWLPQVRLEYTPGHQDWLRAYEKIAFASTTQCQRGLNCYLIPLISRIPPFSLMLPKQEPTWCFQTGQ